MVWYNLSKVRIGSYNTIAINTIIMITTIVINFSVIVIYYIIAYTQGEVIKNKIQLNINIVIG